MEKISDKSISCFIQKSFLKGGLRWIFFSLLLILFSTVIIPLKSYAVPAYDELFELKQPSGFPFEAMQHGDEWYNWVETKDGYGVYKNTITDNWEYYLPSADTDSTEAGSKGRLGQIQDSLLRVIVGEVDPSTVGIPKGLRPSKTSVIKPQSFALDQNISPEKSLQTGLEEGLKSTAVSGTMHLLVIAVDYVDATATYTADQIQPLLFGASNSVSDYYRRTSYSSVTISPATESQGTSNDGFIGWLRLSGNHPNTGSNLDARNQQIAKSAILAADPYINYAQYDTNGNGIVEPTELSVMIVVAGYEAATGGPSPSVWAHAGGISGGCQVDGKTIYSYAQFGEKHGDRLATFGVMAHELGHLMFGLPDLYDTDTGNGDSHGIGFFDLMGGGCWGAVSGAYGGSSPTQLSAWSKEYLSWGIVNSISSNQSVSFPKTDGNSSSIFRVNTLDSNQYFLIENRQFTGYDIGFQGATSVSGHGGLVIYHIDKLKTPPQNWLVNADENDKGVDVEEANEGSLGYSRLDTKTSSADTNMFFFSGNNTSFTDTTTPGSKLKNGNLTNISVTDISNYGDTMTATVVRPPTTLQTGDRVKATASLNIRDKPCTTCPGVTRVCTASTGNTGTIVGGPQQANNYTWWQISWDNGTGNCSNGTTGWSVEDYLEKTSGTVQITVITSPTGLSITVDGSSYTSPHIFNWSSGSSHTISVSTPQYSSDAKTRYSYYAWSNGGSQTQTITTPSSNQTYEAFFYTAYLLDTSVNPNGSGSISLDPSGPWYNPNQSVQLTATANSGYIFKNWSGDLSGSSNPTTLTMNGSKSVTAVYVGISANPVAVPYTSTSLTVDGNVSESDWNISTDVSKTVIGTTNNTTKFGVLWDSAYLYVGMKVLDDTLYNDSTFVHEDDSVEIYIDGDHNHGTTYDNYDRQFLKGWNDSALVEQHGKTTGVLHGWAPISGGYSIELAIPWSNLGITPTAGMTLGFSLGYNDDDNGAGRDGQAVWIGTANSWLDTSAFGDIILEAASPPTPTPANTLTPTYIPTSTPTPTPLPGGLEAYYTLDEGSGTIANDSSGNGNHGAINGATWGTGIRGGALSLDGVNDYVDLGNPANLQPGTVSLSVWFKTTATSGRIVRKRTYGYGLDVLPTGKISFWINNATAAKFTATSPNAYNDNAWHHAVGVYGGSMVKLYIDGSQVASANAGTIFYGTGGIAIGRDGDYNGSYFNGLIDDVCVYNRTMSDQEVVDLYEQFATDQVTVPYVSSNLAVDGNVSESAWNIATDVSKVVIGATNNTTKFGVLWDNTYLYVGMKVLDDNLYNDSTYVNDDDSVEIYIDGDHNHGTTYDSYDRQFVKGWNDSTLVEQHGKTTGVLHGWAPIPGGYSIELAIPWSNLGLIPTAGMTIGFSVGYNDDENGAGRDGQAVWIGTANNWMDTSALGDIVLGEAPSPTPTPPPTPTPLPGGPKALYTLDEGSGAIANDSSGNGNHGAINGAAWATGISGGALSLDGVNDYVDLGNPENLQPGTVSLSVWFKTTATSGRIVRKRMYGYGLDVLPTGNISFWINNAAAAKFTATSPNAYNDNTWHHAVGVYGGSLVKLYIDGSQVTSASAGTIFYGAGAIAIGRDGDYNGSYFKGLVDDVRIFQSELSAQAVLDLYDQSSSGLVSHWKFDEGIGTIANDWVDGNNGTINGATWTAGKSGSALSLDGNDYVQIPGLLGQPKNITLSAWVQLNAKDTSGAEVISLGDHVTIRFDSSNGAKGFYYDGTTWRGTDTGLSYAGTGWHHVVYVMDDANNIQKVYVDGVEKGFTVHTQSISYTGLGSNTFIGRHGNGGGNYDFNGIVDDVRVYNKALNAQEVQGLYNNVSALVSNISHGFMGMNNGDTYATFTPPGAVTPTHPAITLRSFKAGEDDGRVTLTWETSGETDNAGFNLYRARRRNGVYTQINNALIDAKGDVASSYSFEDQPGHGNFYYYKLESVDYDGVSIVHKPVKVKVRSEDNQKRRSSRQRP